MRKRLAFLLGFLMIFSSSLTVLASDFDINIPQSFDLGGQIENIDYGVNDGTYMMEPYNDVSQMPLDTGLPLDTGTQTTVDYSNPNVVPVAMATPTPAPTPAPPTPAPEPAPLPKTGVGDIIPFILVGGLAIVLGSRSLYKRFA